MKANDDLTGLAPSNRTGRKLQLVIFSFLALGALRFVVALFVPVLDGPNSRQHANEAVAVANLQHVDALQSAYATAYPTKGFACELPLLKPASAPKDVVYDRDQFLVTGAQSGYKFAVANCPADSTGRILGYQLTAVPVDPGKSGFRAFCTDDSDAIWFDADGSGFNCLAARHPLD